MSLDASTGSVLTCLALALVACSSSDSSGSGGATGSGGAAAVTTTSATTGSGGAGGSGGSTGVGQVGAGGAGGFIGGGGGQGPGALCLPCVQAECSDALATCNNDADCQGFLMCVDSCTDDPACLAACVSDHPNGQPVVDCACAHCADSCPTCG